MVKIKDKQCIITHLRVTQPLPEGGAVQNTCVLVRLLGMLSVTAGGQLVMNCVSLSSIICGTMKPHMRISKSLNIWGKARIKNKNSKNLIDLGVGGRGV